jgi:hypothetical protein
VDNCPGEGLDYASGGDVLLAGMGDQRPRPAQLTGEVTGAVPRDRQAGAAGWPVWGEAAKHGNRAGPSGGVQGALVSLSLLAAGQEVEDRPVMPGLVAVARLPGQHVGDYPLNLASPAAQPPPGMLHPGCRDVQDGDVPEATVQQGTGQR